MHKWLSQNYPVSGRIRIRAPHCRHTPGIFLKLSNSATQPPNNQKRELDCTGMAPNTSPTWTRVDVSNILGDRKYPLGVTVIGYLKQLANNMIIYYSCWLFSFFTFLLYFPTLSSTSLILSKLTLQFELPSDFKYMSVLPKLSRPSL